MGNKYRSLAKNTIIFAIGNFGSKLITFFLVPLYTNYLTTGQYGTADFVINISNMLLPIISLVIQDSVLRFGISKDYNKKSVISNAFLVFIVGSTVAIMIYPLLGLYPAIRVWRIYLIITMICSNANAILLSYTKAKEQNKLFAIAGIVQTIVLAALNVILIAFLKLGTEGYLLSNIIANVAVVLLLFLGTGTYKDLKGLKIDKPLLKQMLAYSIPLIANNISWWVLNSSDKVMIEHYIDENALGLYTAASKIPNLLSIFSTIFASAWTVSSIKEYEENQDRTFYSNIFKCFSLLMFLGGSALLTITKPFSSIYIGSEFLPGWICTPALVIGMVYFSFSSFYGAIYGAVKKNIPTTISTLIAAIINIIINILLIPTIGILAAAISTAVSYFAVGIIRMLHSRTYFKFDIDFTRFILNSVIIITQAILVTLQWHIYLASIVCFALIALINQRDLRFLGSTIHSLVISRIRNKRK